MEQFRSVRAMLKSNLHLNTEVLLLFAMYVYMFICMFICIYVVKHPKHPDRHIDPPDCGTQILSIIRQNSDTF